VREDGLLATHPTEEDHASEVLLRPRTLDEFVGQRKIKQRLSVSMEASVKLGRPLDHLLLSGPPGLGKTTLARIIAAEMGAQLRSTSGPAVERPGDLAAILSGLEYGDVLFIDEIHRLPRVIEEVLYSAMEDFALDIVVGKGPTAQSLRLSLPRFTLVGATTRIGTVTAPLRDRFGMVDRLDYYEDDELKRIVTRSATIIGVPVTGHAAGYVAVRSRGTPRIANRLLTRMSEYAVARADGRIDSTVAAAGMELWEVDDLGLDKVDRLILDATVMENALLGLQQSYRWGHLAELLRLPWSRAEERQARGRCMDMLERFGLAEMAHEDADSLPLGSQKIVEVARALVAEPRVVLLDEPAAGLGADDVTVLLRGLRGIAAESDLCMIIIEHDLQLVTSLCPHIAVLDFGRIISEGGPDDVTHDPAVIEAYLGHGFAARLEAESLGVELTDSETPAGVE